MKLKQLIEKSIEKVTGLSAKLWNQSRRLLQNWIGRTLWKLLRKTTKVSENLQKSTDGWTWSYGFIYPVWFVQRVSYGGNGRLVSHSFFLKNINGRLVFEYFRPRRLLPLRKPSMPIVIYSVKSIWTALNRVVGVVVVYLFIGLECRRSRVRNLVILFSI